MFDRRQVLLGGAAAALGAGLSAPRRGWAATTAPEDRKFLFVLAKGGWDVVSTFAPVFSANIARERRDTVERIGDRTWVSNPGRPSVDAWWAANASRVSTMDGLLIKSINHPMCRRLWMCGTTNTTSADWPTRIGAAAADRYVVPYMIVQGQAVAAEHEALTCMAGNAGQLETLLDGSGTALSDVPMAMPTPEADALVDAFSKAAALRALPGARSPEHAVLLEAHAESAGRLATFQRQTEPMDLSPDALFETQIAQAMQYLGEGTSRCASIILPYDYDSHSSSSSDTMEGTFAYLAELDRSLRSTPGTFAPSLADETVVVVYSEMGRTPFYNSLGGRDHWMYTSCMLWGAGVRGGRQIGGYDAHLIGLPVDLRSGEVDAAAGLELTPDVIGSTLLRLAGVDPAEALGADTSVEALLA